MAVIAGTGAVLVEVVPQGPAVRALLEEYKGAPEAEVEAEPMA